MLVSLTVGKVDAGVAVLLTEDKRLIEFPSILLPPTITTGSIVDITVSRNHPAESASHTSFSRLQSRILNTYGLASPSAPILRLRNATQTSLVLEWDSLHLATSTLRSLSLYRNGSKAGNIPRPHEMLATKISGLGVDTAYSFHLILRTSGGTFTSNTLEVRTQKMTDLSGITVTPGVMAPQLREALERAVQRIGGRVVENVRIDTTHFVCMEGRGKEWERAQEMNIPVVRPEWVEGCEREGKVVGVRGYYLDANPKDRRVGSREVVQNSPAVSNTIGGGSSAVQSPLPHRPVEKEEEQSVEGEPGPEVPPTPSSKDLPPTPGRIEDGGEGDRDDDEGEEEKEPQGRKEKPSSGMNDAETSSSHDRQAQVEEGEEGNEEMEDVKL